MNKFATEADLCAAFVAQVHAAGWCAYPETGGFDLLLSDKPGSKATTQIGIEAKLKANWHVLSQVLPDTPMPRVGPNYRGVLVPDMPRSFETVARAARIIVYVPNRFEPPADLNPYDRWPRNWSGKHCWTPPFVPGGPAGVPSPSPVTPWVMGAVKLCLLLRKRGFVTHQDFKACDISFSPNWRSMWLMPTGEREGRAMRYVINPEYDEALPDRVHSDVTEYLQKDRT